MCAVRPEPCNVEAARGRSHSKSSSANERPPHDTGGAVSTHPVSRLGKLSAIVIAFFLIGFLGISYFLGLSYCDDRTPLVGNHPIAAEFARITASTNPGIRLNLQIRFALRHRAALDQLLADQQNPASPN